MLNLLQTQKPLIVNGEEYGNAEEALKHFMANGANGAVEIVLNRKSAKVNTEVRTLASLEKNVPCAILGGSVYRVSVRQYMTKPATAAFDFHTKWNKDIPMPMRTMEGIVLQETPGMVRMKLQAAPHPSSVCSRCGRTLTHAISMIVGLGPECGGHAYDIGWSAEQVEASMDSIRAKMALTTWEGWVIRSAIEKWEVVSSEPVSK